METVTMSLKSLEWICPNCGSYYINELPVRDVYACERCGSKFTPDKEDTLEVIQSQITNA